MSTVKEKPNEVQPLSNLLAGEGGELLNVKDLGAMPAKKLKGALIQMYVNTVENQRKVKEIQDNQKSEIKSLKKAQKLEATGIKISDAETKLKQAKKTEVYLNVERNSILKMAKKMGIDMSKDINNIIAIGQ